MRNIFVVACTISLPVVAGESAAVLHRSSSGDNHCYLITVSGNRAIKSVTLGSSWEGKAFVIDSGGKLEVSDLTPGWTATVIDRTRYGYRDIEIKAPSAFLGLKNYRGAVAALCLASSDWPIGQAPDFEKLPYSIDFNDSGNRELGTTRPASGEWAEMAFSELVKKTQEASGEDLKDAVKDVSRLLDAVKD